jgi:hypothetical protein
MTPTAASTETGERVATWPLPYGATLGSSVRVKGILQEVRAGLPMAARKQLQANATELILRVPAGTDGEDWIARISKSLDGIEDLPVIPREIEDILSITTTERHRWLKDGRLPSAGTRTVKLRGRAKKITFHVFDPQFVEDALNRDVVVDWREQDAETTRENRRRAAWKAKQKRIQKTTGKADDASADEGRPNLIGWEEFERTGLP